MDAAAGAAPQFTLRQKAERLRSQVRDEYFQGWREHHRQIAEVVNPRRPQFLTSDRMIAGNKQNDSIINNVATEASGSLRAGLRSGTASSSRPWFKLTTHQPDLWENEEVKEWLHQVEVILTGVIAKSNFYEKIEELYGDLGDFGTAPMHIEADEKEVIRCYVFPIGSYFLAQDARGKVDTIFRDVPMTAAQLVKKFGYENCCLQVRVAYKQKNLYQYFDVVHFIIPNEDWQDGALGPTGKTWLSGWYELARTEVENHGMLHIGGFDYFPVMAPRWSVTGSNVWGSSPGMNALGDARALQNLEEQKMQVVQKINNPPLNVPASLRGQQASLLPGAENPIAGAGAKIEPAMSIHPQALEAIEATIREHEQRIRASYYADLFRLLDTLQKGQMTAYEVQQRVQEKMQLIGPTYERVEDELLDPAIEAILHILMEGYYLPPVPQVLLGAEVKAEYTSIIAQAQKAADLAALRETLQVVGNIAAVDPEAMDNLDIDYVVHDYVTKLGLPPKVLRTPEARDAMRQAKQQMAMKQQQMAQAGQLAAGAKVLSETNTDGKNALTDMLAGSGRV